jgi:hypothetical protein
MFVSYLYWDFLIETQLSCVQSGDKAVTCIVYLIPIVVLFCWLEDCGGDHKLSRAGTKGGEIPLPAIFH